MRKYIFLIMCLYSINTYSQNLGMNIDCSISIDNNINDSVKITIIDENLNKYQIYTINKLYYFLRYNKQYSMLFEYKDYQPQMIYFNTKTINYYPNLTCYFNINLRKTGETEILELVRVYYDEQSKEFNYKLINFN